MKRLLLQMAIGSMAASAALSACGSPAEDPMPPAVGGRVRKVDPEFVDFELPGPNTYWFCHGSTGVYVTEGGNDDTGKSAAPAVLANDPECQG